MDTLVTTEWLSQHLDDPDLVVLDCNVRTESQNDGTMLNISGRADYNQGHIPGAGFADLKGELCDSNNPIEFSPPTPQQFCTVMGELGVGDNSRVVLYDTEFSAWAARVWWMLRWVGFDNAALLDGGLKTWKSEGRPVSTEAFTKPAKQLTPKPRPQLIADKNEVLASIDDDSITLIDTMPAEFYSGELAIYQRAGHITGAINTCAMDLLDESGRFRSEDELASIVTDTGRGNHNRRYITYCGGGIMASSNAFIMTRLGFTNVAVYTASLQEWAADPSNPMTIEK